MVSRDQLTQRMIDHCQSVVIPKNVKAELFEKPVIRYPPKPAFCRVKKSPYPKGHYDFTMS